MKTRRKNIKAIKKPSRLTMNRRKLRLNRVPKEPTLLEKIAQATDELQMLRSRLANAGDGQPTVGMHRITALETELEKLWEQRRRERAAPLRETALSEEEERNLAFPSSGRGRA